MRGCVSALLVLIAGLASACASESPAPPAAAPPPAFVGAQACASCHQDANAEWAGSDHHEAMQVANSSTVKGNFAGARVTIHGVESSFSSDGGKYRVRTDGADGKLADFDVKYVFGFRPLQQYLLELPGGRYQALSIAWDTPRERAGRPALVPHLPGRSGGPHRRAALDRAVAELELHVRGVPLHEPAEELPRRHADLRHVVVGD